MKRFDYIRSSRAARRLSSRHERAPLFVLCGLIVTAVFGQAWTTRPHAAPPRRATARAARAPVMHASAVRIASEKIRRPPRARYATVARGRRPHVAAPPRRLRNRRRILARVLAVSVGEQPQAIVAVRSSTRIVTVGDLFASRRITAITLAGIQLDDGSRLRLAVRR